MKFSIVASLVSLLLISNAQAQENISAFSVGPGTQASSGNRMNDATIYRPRFPNPIAPRAIYRSGTSLVNVDGFSFGIKVTTGGFVGTERLFRFSVDRGSGGVGGSDLAAQAGVGDEHTDIYESDWSVTGGKFSNVLYHDGDSASGSSQQLNLNEDFFAPNNGVDGFDQRAEGRPFGRWLRYTVDNDTIANNLLYAPFSGADIFRANADDDFVLAPDVFASATQLGLDPRDDIDALQIIDRGIVGQLDAQDIILFSLARESHSLMNDPAFSSFTPGSVLLANHSLTTGGTPVEFAAPGDLGLSGTSNLNALHVIPIPAP